MGLTTVAAPGKVDIQLLHYLKELAREAQSHAYAPYSKFKVGATVLTESGEVFTGCNVENASYGLTICAERAAIFKAVEAGYTKITVCVIVSDAEAVGAPCGACRQVLYEFSDDMYIYDYSKDDKLLFTPLDLLLPYAFGPNDLKEFNARPK